MRFLVPEDRGEGSRRGARALWIERAGQWLDVSAALGDLTSHHGDWVTPLDLLLRESADSQARTARVEELANKGLPVLADPEEAEEALSRAWAPLLGGTLWCVGRNYVAHAHELGNEPPGEPILFQKPRASLLGNGETVTLPAGAERVDYEGELALIVGAEINAETDVENLPLGELLFGVTLLNDITERSLQARMKEKGKPWTIAKGKRGFCPLGPAVYMFEHPDRAEEELLGMVMETRLNGELVQQGDPSLWIFSARYLLAYLARHVGLLPGDLIATGTPAGVGPVVPGDTVEVRCREIGQLTTHFRL